jgi:hypothetical protein
LEVEIVSISRVMGLAAAVCLLVSATAQAGPSPVEAGFGTIKIDGLMQNWFVWNSNNLSGDDRDGFKTRRMEIKLSGQINPQVKWAVMFDVSKSLSLDTSGATPKVKQESRALQDLVITYALKSGQALDVGQFKIPVGMEGLTSSSQLDTVERALFTIRGNKETGGVFGDFRDLGVVLRGTYESGEYQIGVFNGDKQNAPDTNDQKAGVARVIYKPKTTPGLQLGASYYKGETTAANLERRRTGYELRYDQKAWFLASEEISGSDGQAGGEGTPSSLDSSGWYVLCGRKMDDKHQVVVRYDVWNAPAPTAGNGGDEKDITLGYNYLMTGHNAKLQFNLVRKNFALHDDQTLFLTNAQVAF